MGNVYRCAGSASETYINGVKTNDRVDIKSLSLPLLVYETACFTTFNNKECIANLTNGSTECYLYSFDGNEWKREATYPLNTLRSICTFNNTIYAMDDANLMRLEGTGLTTVTALPENSRPYGRYDGVLFTLGQFLYCLSAEMTQNSSKIYRFTGSGWTAVATIADEMSSPSCVLYNGAIHILASIVGGYIHKVFNGSTVLNSVSMPGMKQGNAAYVYNNKIRVFALYLHGQTYDYDGNSMTWTTNDPLVFEGGVNRETLLDYFGAFVLNNEQYLITQRGDFLIKITNPIKLGQYFVS